MSIEKAEIGDAVLYCGDCLEIMTDLDEVDHVITDVPYSDNTHKQAKTNKGKGHGTTLIDFSHISPEVFAEIMRASLGISRRWVVTTCDHRHAPICFDWPEFVRIGAWVKPNPMPQISADRPGQGHEAVLIMHAEGKKRWNRGGSAGIWTIPVAPSEYPTQKPIKLIDQFVSDFTDPGEMILDPCMGSGTSGVAAVRQGRKFIGIEIRPEAFDLACERIEQAQKQGRLF